MEVITILKALKHLKKQKKGQNIENVVYFYGKESEWKRPKVLMAVEKALKEQFISQIGTDSLRILEKGHQLLESSFATGEFDGEEQEKSHGSKCSFDSEDYIDFKKYIHAEVLSLKAKVSKRTIPETGIEKPTADYEQLYIRSFEERITSLEGQLDDKQKIIENYSKKNILKDLGLKKKHIPRGTYQKSSQKRKRTEKAEQTIKTKI